MYEALETALKIEFKNLELYKRCFTHRSFLNEASNPSLHHNERLEFLGDAVLELVTTDYLFHNYPDKNEGEMTSWRSMLVQGANLAKVARKLDLGQYLLLSKGEEASGGRNKDYLLANTVEALIGAIYVDLGFEKAKQFISDFIMVDFDELLASGANRDGKSVFQEYAQEQFGITPHYDLIAETGPDHDKNFEMGAFIGEKLIATGNGTSKQKAEQKAAMQAMEQLSLKESGQ